MVFEEKKLKIWNDQYWNLIKRNIGMISISEQNIIKEAKVTIFGVGGLGGPIVCQLVRCGCERLTICDNDKFTESNLNRQLCTLDNIGEYKVDFFADYVKKINPEVLIKKFYEVNEQNLSSILIESELAVLSLDDPLTSIIISRECLKRNIPLLESWGIPYLCAWYFTSKSLDYESCYGLETKELSIDKIQKSTDLQKKIKTKMLTKLTKFPGIRERFDREPGALNGILSGRLPSVSFAPIVQLSASYLAFEAIFSGLLKIKPMILAPHIIGYDYFEMKPLKFKIS
ncbi:MAG: ThiF family adenylyltransferase [Promethearchaeota archaeon]|nr:MAG: ThiF family adenylyltransferase [Candidatus Lokiarchaeota archaeon]